MSLNFQCYSLDDMLTVFDIDHSVGADKFDFKELCPAFIQQVKSGACKVSGETETEVDKDMGKSKFNFLINVERENVLQRVVLSQNLVLYFLPKKIQTVYQSDLGRQFCLNQAENFRNKWGVLQGSLKFPTETYKSYGKCAYYLHAFTSSSHHLGIMITSN